MATEEEKQVTAFDAEKSLHEVHLTVLPSQGNIYTAGIVSSNPRSYPGSRSDGDDSYRTRHKVLVGSLFRTFKSFGFEKPEEPEIRDIIFQYLPTGCEVISMDWFPLSTDQNKKSANGNGGRRRRNETEILFGITWASPALPDDSRRSYFFNTYRSTGDLEDIICVDTLELDYIPYQTSHARCCGGKEMAFLIAGSDLRFHMFLFSHAEFSFLEVAEPFLQEQFPELVLPHPSVPIWTDMKVIKNERRLTAIGYECGKVALHITDLESSEVQSYQADVEGTISRVQLFLSGGSEDVDKKEDEQEPVINMLAVSADFRSMVFHNVLEWGVSRSCILAKSDEYDAATTGSVIDLDFDGKPEIIVGTYGQMILVYKEDEDTPCKWKLIWTKAFNNPIHSICEADLTRDGVREIAVITAGSIVILQHDMKSVKELLEQRLSAKIEL